MFDDPNDPRNCLNALGRVSQSKHVLGDGLDPNLTFKHRGQVSFQERTVKGNDGDGSPL